MARFFTPSRLSENIRETPEGFLLCLNVPIARTGWQEYGAGETPLEVGEDGKVLVYREAKEVFRPQTIASFVGKSVTIKHPQDFVEPKNWKILTHGVVQNPRKGGEADEDGEEQLLADLLITDDFAIGLVKNGLREVSCGYDAEYEQTGEGEGRQFNIVGNHVALVEQGRAGSSYAIKDHKGEGMSLKDLAEKIKNLGKTVDEAVAEHDKATKTKPARKAAKDSKEEEADDAASEQVTYDDVMKAVKDLGAKIDSMGEKKSEDEEEEEKPAPKKKEAAKEEKSEDEEQEGDVGSRLDKLEAAVSKILEKLGNKGAEDEEEESEEDMSGDEDMEESEDESEEMADEEGEEGEESQKKSTGDAARFEILTPGKKYTGKDARAKCLKAFAQTEDGAKVLKDLGQSKTFDAKSVDTLFLAASAVVRSKRGTGLKGTKEASRYTADDVEHTASNGVSAEELNEINAKAYGAAK